VALRRSAAHNLLLGSNLNSYNAETWVGIGALFYLFLSALMLWWIPKRAAAKSRIEERDKRLTTENESRKTLAQILGGFLVIASFLISLGTLLSSVQNQISERFTKAVGLLEDDKNKDAKIGGVYSLEKIAQDSSAGYVLPSLDYYGPSMEVLASALRQHAGSGKETTLDCNEEAKIKAAAADVLTSALFRVITRRQAPHRYEDQQLNLGSINIAGANLEHGNLRYLWLNCSHMEGGDLSGADLSHASLSGVFLGPNGETTSSLTRVTLHNTDVAHAHLEGADLQYADIHCANFAGAHLKGASLKKANRERSKDASCQSDKGADFSGAELQGVDFTGAELQGVDFTGAKLQGVDFTGADLQRAILCGADLRGSKGLTCSQLDGIYFDKKTDLGDLKCSDLKVTEQCSLVSATNDSGHKGGGKCWLQDALSSAQFLLSKR
jgi:uncharacterized protein YjbI with pentapeptide repeats